jgi:hypothetical protein
MDRVQDSGWTGPHLVTLPGAAEPGASIFAIEQSPNIGVVSFAGIDGRPAIIWKIADAAWKGPAHINWFRVARPYVQKGDAPEGPATGAAIPVSSVPTVVRVANSIRRVAQLTGENTLNDLAQWNAKGVDLGANVRHGNDTYVFFGDTTLKEYTNDRMSFPLGTRI